MTTDIRFILFIVMVVLANAVWIYLSIRFSRKFQASSISLHKDPSLDKLLQYVNMLRDFNISSQSKSNIGEARELIHNLADELSSLWKKYRSGRLKIERYLSVGLHYLAFTLNRSYVRGQERRILSMPSINGVTKGFERLVYSIREKEIKNVYDAMADLTFIIKEGEQPTSDRSISQQERLDIANLLQRMFSDVLDNSNDPNFEGRSIYFQQFRKLVYDKKESHLLSLYLVLHDYQDRLIKDSKYNSKLKLLHRNWLDSWVSGNNNDQYTYLAMIMTVGQKSRFYIDKECYIDKKL